MERGRTRGMTRPDVQHAMRRAPYRPRSRRNVLCVFPSYAPSFGTFQHAYPLMPGVQAFMPPQGMLVIAAYLPREWNVRFVDENMRPATDRDYQWADAVFISGMHVQRASIDAINAAAHRNERLTILGGPSVSGCPEYYPDVDILHIGELGDATDALIESLDKDVCRPRVQRRFETAERLPLSQFPIPAYELIEMPRYFLASIQFSSGCPYRCEFCDIPELYGRQPRLKAPEQILAELDAIVAAGANGAVYFVDDNFIGNRKAARELLPHLIDWQRRRGYPVEFACEATVNMAQQKNLLAMMREANFRTVFCGIETPEPAALAAMQKGHNMKTPLLDAVRTFNAHGMEVVAGIILGLDTDTPQTADKVLDFIAASKIPMLTINLLYALPRTPLYRRLEAAGRVKEDGAAASNVEFALPYEQVLSMWGRCIAGAYAPENLLERFAHQTEHTFPNWFAAPRKVRAAEVVFGMRILSRVLWQVGARADWRSDFWQLAAPLMRRGRIEELIHIGLVSHHLVRFAREALAGEAEAAFYADPAQSANTLA